MPMRYLDKPADEALKEIIEMLEKKMGIYASHRHAVMYLYNAWKEGKQ